MGIAGLTSSVSLVANTAINSMDLSKIGQGGFFNTDMFTTGLKDGNAWVNVAAGAVSTGVTSGMTSKFNSMGAATNKFYGGAMNLATSAASTAATYATHLAFAKGDFTSAFDNMGGISLNVLSVGTIADMIGGGIARKNEKGKNNFEKETLKVLLNTTI